MVPGDCSLPYPKSPFAIPFANVSFSISGLSNLGNSGEAKNASLTLLVVHLTRAGGHFLTRNLGPIFEVIRSSRLSRSKIRDVKDDEDPELISPKSMS